MEKVWVLWVQKYKFFFTLFFFLLHPYLLGCGFCFLDVCDNDCSGYETLTARFERIACIVSMKS